MILGELWLLQSGTVARWNCEKVRIGGNCAMPKRFAGWTALVTGASSGIGAEFARQLAETAGTLVLVARRRERLEALSAKLATGRPELSVHVREVDLTKPQEIDALLRSLEADGIAVDLLVNNAGLGDLGPFVTSEPVKIEAMLAVNVVALTRLTRALLPAMLARQRGAVINVSSSASFLPIANFAVYAATKAYVTSFSEAIRAELRGRGVSVTALSPGPVHTEFTDVAHRAPAGAALAPELMHVSVARVVRSVLRAAARDRAQVIPGLLMNAGMLMVRALPMPVLRFFARASAK